MIHFIDRTVFNFESIEIDLKAMFLMFEPSEMLPRVVCLINQFNLTDLSKAIYEMEIACALKDLPIDNHEAGCADLKRSIDLLRKYATSYTERATGEINSRII